MKLKTKDFVSALKELKPIVPTAGFAPVMSCARITTGDKLVISVCDFDQFALRTLDFNGEADNFCVSFSALMWAIGEADETMLVREDNHLLVKCGHKISKIGLVDLKDFPDAPDRKTFKLIGTYPADIAIGIKAVHGFEHRDRDPLTGTAIRGSAKQVECLASDGVNFARWSSALISADFDITVPAKFCDALADAMTREDSKLLVSERMAMVRWPGGFYSCKLCESKFPPSDIFIKQQLSPIGKLEIAPFMREVEACIALTNAANAPAVEVEFTKKKLQTSFLGTNENEFEGEFEPYKCVLNARSTRLCLSGLGESCKAFGSDRMMKFESGDVTVYTSLMR